MLTITDAVVACTAVVGADVSMTLIGVPAVRLPLLLLLLLILAQPLALLQLLLLLFGFERLSIIGNAADDVGCLLAAGGNGGFVLTTFAPDWGCD